MKSPFEKELERKIRGLSGRRFEELVEKILKKKYGENFTPMNDNHDGGSDGIINNNEIVAVYSPKKRHDLDNFRSKVDDDFSDYQDNWQDDYPEWTFIYGGEFTYKRIIHLDQTRRDCGRKGLMDIIDLVLEFNWPKRRKIAEHLDMNPESFEYNAFKEVIDDILSSDTDFGMESERDKPPGVEEKIKQNFENTEARIRGFENIAQDLGDLRGLLRSSYNEQEIRVIKNKIINKFEDFEGSFDSNFENTIDHFASRRPEDDIYGYYVRVIVYYCFERCLIGAKEGDR